jgi:hypothetical protein
MKKKPRKETHPRDGEVWVNPTTESLRKDECLCLNCAKCRPGQPYHCPIAQALFDVCKKGKIALAVTRCPEWEEAASSILKKTKRNALKVVAFWIGVVLMGWAIATFLTVMILMKVMGL